MTPKVIDVDAHDGHISVAFEETNHTKVLLAVHGRTGPNHPLLREGVAGHATVLLQFDDEALDQLISALKNAKAGTGGVVLDPFTKGRKP